MYESFATVWERVADAIPDAAAVVQGDRRVTYARGRGPRRAPGGALADLRRRPRHQGRALPPQLPRVHGVPVRAVEAARGAGERELPLPRRRARAARRQRRRRGARVPRVRSASGWPTHATACRASATSSSSTTTVRDSEYEELVALPRPGAADRALGRRPPALVHRRHHRPAQGRALAPGHAARVRADRRLRAAGRDAVRLGRPADRRRAAAGATGARRSCRCSPPRSCTRPRSTRPTPRSRSAAPSCCSTRGHTDGDTICATIERERPSVLEIVGDVLMRRIAHALDAADARGEPYDLSSLRRIHNSGAMVSAPLKDALLSRGTMHVYDSLGSSEAVGFGVALDDRARARARPRASRSAPTRACSPTATATSHPARARSACSPSTPRAPSATTRIPSAARPRSARSTARLYADPRRPGAARRRRHADAARARLELHQLRRREDLARGGRGGAQGAPGRRTTRS